MTEKTRKFIIGWLFSGVLLILIMVSIGGITRLTHSGLSMVNWDFIGSLPPMTEEAWQASFEDYQQYPEYKELNYHFTLSDFKSIFWWEYIHRQFGRLIGMVFLLPFLWLIATKRIDRKLFFKLLIMLGMGACQALLGWYMVKSGLANVPRVSQFRLAAHLLTAFLTCSYIFWVALDLIYEKGSKPLVLPGMRKWGWALFFVLIFQIVYGAFVAGLRAGLVHNTWPLMDGALVHEAVTSMSPMWQNFFEGKSGVQFVHRYGAFAVVGLVLTIWLKCRKFQLDSSQRKAVNAISVLVASQFVLGVLTLLMHVPLFLGIAHQVVALMLLLGSVMFLHRFRSKQLA